METTTNIIEQTKKWEDLTTSEKSVCLIVHAKALNLHRIRNAVKVSDTLTRIFDLGRPYIVFGYKDDKPQYCRIAAESLDVMKLLIRQYL